MESNTTDATSPETSEAQGAPQVPTAETRIKEAEAKYLYLYAEFENFKKRALKERSELLKFGWENALREFIQVGDNFERALAHTPPGTDSTWLEGIKMVQTQLNAAIAKQGAQPIPAVGNAFDANLHEAVGQTPDESPAGSIIHEALRGYTLHGRLLRAARVILSTGKPDASA